jgi:hypothetical protein
MKTSMLFCAYIWSVSPQTFIRAKKNRTKAVEQNEILYTFSASLTVFNISKQTDLFMLCHIMT